MINGINHITISVSNIDTSFGFYKDVLHLKPIMKSEKSAYLQCGRVWIALVEEKDKEHLNNLYSHIALNTTKKGYYRVINALNKSGIQRWQDNKTEGESFYFLDPSGNKMEVHYSTLRKRIKSMRNQANIELYR